MSDLRRQSPPPASATDTASLHEVTVVRSEEILTLSTVRAPYRRLRVRKRIVEETKTVTVDVRREELVIDDVTDSAGLDDTRPVIDAVNSPIILVLHEEQVTITRVVVPVERVRVHIETVGGATEVVAERRREVVDVEGDR